MKSRLHSPLRALAALAVLVAGCLPLGGGRAVSPVAMLEGANARLPDVAFAEVTSFAGDRLFAYMNGAAEAYYAKGFRDLGTADAKWRATDAKLEVYLVDSPAHAKALFDEFNDGKGAELPAGLASASWAARELEGIFHRGLIFCRVIVYGDDGEARQLLHALATAVDQSIPD